jgi:aminoglycoside 6'-N-acetyltransferase I
MVALGIAYRMANIDDLKIVTELSIKMCEGDYCGEHDDDDVLNAIQNPKMATFIAFDADKAVGFSRADIRHESIWTENDIGPWGHLDGIFVLSEYRNQGISQVLATMCEDWARENGCVEFGSDCDFDNDMSLVFHLKAGFKVTHRLIHFSKKL